MLAGNAALLFMQVSGAENGRRKVLAFRCNRDLTNRPAFKTHHMHHHHHRRKKLGLSGTTLSLCTFLVSPSFAQPRLTFDLGPETPAGLGSRLGETQ